MTEVNTELDISLLVGEMPSESCDHPAHGSEVYHADGDEQYVILNLPCGCETEVHVFCGRYVTALKALRHALMECVHCGHKFELGVALRYLGPIIHKK